MKNITKNNNKLINARFIVSGVLAMFRDSRVPFIDAILGNSRINPFNLATFDIGQDMLDT